MCFLDIHGFLTSRFTLQHVSLSMEPCTFDLCPASALQAVWAAYVASMRQAGFTDGLPMYAASGLLTYGASTEMQNIIATLKAAGLCSEVLYKELYIPQEELNGAPLHASAALHSVS